MDIIYRLKTLRLVPVVALPTVESGLRLAELLLKCRLAVMEVTYRTECAGEALEQICSRFPELAVIAGTVVSPEQADQAVSAGVEGIVSPGFTARLATHCQARSIAFFPGVCTPSEVQAAREEGLQNLKFFPAAQFGGIKMIELFGALYPDVLLMPTGGINQDNLVDYLNCANVLCCGGTWLSPQKMLAKGDWGEIEQRIKRAVDLLDRQA
ncbi:MAG: bifunctional 4-hydroxy-2-oxoglutarate aldolase/2-dehydro-3-deoxy-phosphogluconate aldolase [Desulfofustis sp.]|nr:bifunctional 4-hydroxy-2-oxoglutarate aldolase/2-dehydro-3-deoxy-phosphogluconate aldolase [Desulfofustis sp.]